MNNHILLSLTLLILPCAALLFVPYITPRRYFFGITVTPGFPKSEAGRAIRRGYVYAVLAAAAIAIASGAVFPIAMPAVVFAPALAAVMAFFHARSRVAILAASAGVTRADAVREAEIGRGPERLPRWTLLALPPFAVPPAVALYLRAHWDEIPERFPVHWGWNGEPNRWVTRTPHDVYGPLWVGGGILLLIVFAGLAGFYGARRSPLRAAMLKIMTAVTYLIAFVFGMVGLLPLRQFSPMMIALPVLVFVAVVLIYSFKLSSDPDIPVETTPDSCWHLSSIYYNPADPALFVQARIGMGYTMNLGNPATWVILGVMLALIPALIFLLR